MRIFIMMSAACLVFVGLLSVAGYNEGIAAAGEETGQLENRDVALQLTPVERMWLAEHPVLRIAGPKAFPPFHFYDSDNLFRGMSADYIRLVFQILDIKMDVQVNLSWPDVLKGAQEKKIDLITCAAKTKEREKYLLFSEPYLSFPLVIISRVKASFMGGLEDLYDKKIAIVQGASAYDWLQRDNIKVIPHFVKTPEEALRSVSLGNAEAHIDNLAAASYLIAKEGLNNLKIAGPAFSENYDLFIAVRNDWQELIPIINKALAAISSSEHLEIRNKWLSVRYESGFNLRQVITWILAVAGVAAVILLILSFWNRRLHKEIVERKKVENALKDKTYTLNSIFRSAPTGIGLVVERKIIRVNVKLCEITGYSSEELLHHNARMLYLTDDDYNYVGSEKYRQIQERGTGTVETRWKRKDGREIDVLLSSTPINPGDLTHGVTFTALDITARKTAEKALKRSEARYRGIVEDQTEFICRFSSEGLISFANSAMSRFFNRTLEKLVGTNFVQFLPSEKRDSFFQSLISLTPDDPLRIYENDGMRGMGEAYWVRWTCRGIFDGGRKLIEVQAVGKDITEQKNLEQRLRQSHKMEAVGALSGGIAHDFNNILGIIIGNAELIKLNEHVSVTSKKSIEEIRTASFRAKDLVNQLLTFSRTSDNLKKPLSLAPVIEESLRLLRSTIPSSVEFLVDIPLKLPAVMADDTQVHQVMINLCTNAADAMAESGGQLGVRLEEVFLEEKDFFFDHSSLPSGNFIRMRVSDTGTGIEAKHQDRIFEPYFTTKELGKGTGLGLAVTHGIMTSHCGGIQVKSAIGKGTVFEVFWPTIEQHAEDTPSEKVELPHGTESILLVDDELPLANLNKLLLETLGYRVEIAENGIEALARFTDGSCTFDAIITDMAMPKMTGDLLAKEILKIRPGFPIILCTGFSNTINEERSQQLGIKKYLLKPVGLQDLAFAVREALA